MHICWIVSHRSGEGGRGFGAGVGGVAPGVDVVVEADGQLGGASLLGKVLSVPVFGFLTPYRTWTDWAKESSPGYGCAVASYHRVQLKLYTRRRASSSACFVIASLMLLCPMMMFQSMFPGP